MKLGVVQHAALVEWRVCYMACRRTHDGSRKTYLLDVDDGFKHVLCDRALGLTKITYQKNVTRLAWTQSKFIDPILVSPNSKNSTSDMAWRGKRDLPGLN